MMGTYPEENTQPIILPSLSEQIWEKFEYFDKKVEDDPYNEPYDAMRGKLLDLWWEQYQKEYKEQCPIFKKGGKK